MSATTSASARVFASVAVRASGAARPRVAVPAPTVSAPAKSARLGPIRLPGRGAKLVVRADGEGLDRDAPELQEKFAIIGCVTPARDDARVPDAAVASPTPSRAVYPKTPTFRAPDACVALLVCRPPPRRTRRAPPGAPVPRPGEPERLSKDSL